MILSNMCIVIVSFPIYDVTHFEISLSFLIKLFFYMAKKDRQNFRYFNNKKKHLPSFLRNSQLPEIFSDLLVDLKVSM